jgi:hypothetical protein
MIVLQKRNVEPVKSPDHPLGRVFGSSRRSVLPPLSPPFANTHNVIKYLEVVASLPTDPPLLPVHETTPFEYHDARLSTTSFVKYT